MGSVAELSSRMLRPGFHPPELEGETVLFLFLLYHASKPGGQQQGSRCSSRLPFHLILLENTGKQGTLPVFLLTSTIPGVGTRGSPASTGTCPSEQVSPELSVPSPLCPHCVPPDHQRALFHQAFRSIGGHRGFPDPSTGEFLLTVDPGHGAWLSVGSSRTFRPHPQMEANFLNWTFLASVALSHQPFLRDRGCSSHNACGLTDVLKFACLPLLLPSFSIIDGT